MVRSLTLTVPCVQTEIVGGARVREQLAIGSCCCGGTLVTETQLSDCESDADGVLPMLQAQARQVCVSANVVHVLLGGGHLPKVVHVCRGIKLRALG